MSSFKLHESMQRGIDMHKAEAVVTEGRTIKLSAPVITKLRDLVKAPALRIAVFLVIFADILILIIETATSNVSAFTLCAVCWALIAGDILCRSTNRP